jgi:hypothetical protein
MHKVEFPDAVSIAQALKQDTDYDNATPDDKIRLHFYAKMCTCVALFEAIDQEMPLSDVSLPALGTVLVKFYTALTPNLSNVMRFQWLPHLLFPSTLGNFPTSLSKLEHTSLVQMAEKLRATNELSPEQHDYMDKFIAGEMPPGLVLADDETRPGN